MAEEFTKDAINPQYEILPLDLSSFASIRHFVDLFHQRKRPLNILINNAAIMGFGIKKNFTEDGFESHFGVNYLGHFLLTQLLLKDLEKSAPSLVINTSSIMHYTAFCFDDYNSEKHFSVSLAYSRSKLAMMYFSDEIKRRYGKIGINSICVHPAGTASNIYHGFVLFVFIFVLFFVLM